MEEVWVVNKRLKAAHDSYIAQTNELNEREKSLNDRLEELERKKVQSADSYGNPDAKDDDVVKINAGGKIISARRGALTQLKGTKMDWLFSGRWEKKLKNERNGEIFLDINPDSFQSIVDYLNVLAISSEDDPPGFPGCEVNCNRCGCSCSKNVDPFFELFGLPDELRQLDSEIIQSVAHAKILRNWLAEDGSDGAFHLLYRSSRDGLSAENFHSKCDNKGSTLTIIETVEGLIVGGFSSSPWDSSGTSKPSSRAFIFCLIGDNVSAPTKMKLKNIEADAICCETGYGPIFGNDSVDNLHVLGKRVYLCFGSNDYQYECHLQSRNLNTFHDVKNIEVFQVYNNISDTQNQDTHDINVVLKSKLEALKEAEKRIAALEENFQRETHYVDCLGSVNKNDVLSLNVSGTIMATNRSTLAVVDESVLARQFDDSMWTEQGNGNKPVQEWTRQEVQDWAKSRSEIPDGIDELFKQHVVDGRQLLALGKEGLKEVLGLTRIGVVYLIHEMICKIQKESEEVLIEHSPYCFGKILDFLRLKRLHSLGLVSDPSLPVVNESKKDMFERVVRFYFPGESSKLILG